ncbi:thiamine pyrophosphate-binding protein [Bacillus horti]|uniref:Acetolactate synthase-1/2/3 large subunit n=1 Tax=Caldalkalibacillus horti TaxID=77523 RepID=A0ABT9VU34_9BACI|nr:thiamine pyrophosphate-binding protein [Bacillus horti]MDQ0164496.1 acetolactate synthase-1/2/3 large subunit [Bacillus horti]
MSKVAATFVQQLKRKGCQYVFGVPGKPIVPLILEMKDQGIEFVLARHECGAGYIATGYALQNQTLAVAMGTSGPGGTNLITAAGQAKAFHAPVLFITGHPPLTQTGKALGQDSSMFGTDLVELFKPVTNFSAKVESGKALKYYLEHAFQKALTGQKGPVHLSIPLDVLLEDIEPFELPLQDLQDKTISTSFDQVEATLRRAERPVMLLGKGVHISGAYDEVRSLAEQWNVPVMTTPGGKGTFPSTHPLSLGSFGLGGTEAATAYLKDGADVMIVIGSKLSDMSLAGLNEAMYPKRVIQFDYNPDFVGKSLPVETVFVQGDAKRNLQQFLSLYPSNPSITIDLMDYLQKEADVRHAVKQQQSEGERLSAAFVMEVLREHLPDETIVYGDDGSHTFYAIKHFDIRQAGTFFFDDVFGAMGHAIGFAIGAKLAKPEQTIACFTGDGCLFMHGTEISTAVSQKANIIFYVLNNGMLDMVDKGMLHNLGRSEGTRYETEIHVAQFAESLGAKGYRCSTVEDIEAATKEALQASGPVVIEILVKKDEIPPTLQRG